MTFRLFDTYREEPSDYKSDALPTELKPANFFYNTR